MSGGAPRAPVFEPLGLFEGDPVPEGEAPFDGRPYLLRTTRGCVSGWWQAAYRYRIPEDGEDPRGWVCLDDEVHLDVEDVTGWAPLEGSGWPYRDGVT